MDKDLIPNNLHHLIPLVEKWGIEDDGERDHFIFKSSNDQLLDLIQNFSDADADNLNKWLIDPQQIKICTPANAVYDAYGV